MTPTRTILEGLNRRGFLKTGLMTGAGALALHRVSAQGEDGGSMGDGASGASSLVSPKARAVPGDIALAPPDKQPPDLKTPETKKKAGWAIVGLGTLSVEEILPAFGLCSRSLPTALVSGHPEKAAKLAEVYGVPSSSIYNYENFDRLRDNPDVDIVYVVLPNSMHAEFTLRGLEAGKHVFCEKPMAVTVGECEAMISKADERSKKLAVAYRLHYEPNTQAVMDMCRNKVFGNIKTFQAGNCQSVKAPNIRLSGPLGGGPVGDLGVYCINAARYTTGEEPMEAVAWMVQPKSDPRFAEVPESVSFLLKYPSGILAQCECSFGTASKSRFEVLCTEGAITMDPAYSYSGLRLITESLQDGTPVSTYHKIEEINQFASEMDAFSGVVLDGGDAKTPGEMGLADLRIILAVLESARRNGEPVTI